MQLIKVNNSRLEEEFILVNVNLYKHDSNYIRPIDKDVQAIFNPDKNKLLKQGSECIRWLLQANDGGYIGRIAAFVNHKTFDKNDQPTGGFGFFDCIDNQEAANMLLQAAKQWLTEKGMEAMDGPINFGERDRFWGLLVDNFEPPTYLVNYNYPYYQKLLEQFGLQNYFNQYTYYRLVDDRLSAEYYQSAEKILTNPDYTFKHIELKNIDKYAEDFRLIYNAGWAKFEGVREMPAEQAQKVFKSMKPIIDERIILFQ